MSAENKKWFVITASAIILGLCISVLLGFSFFFTSHSSYTTEFLSVSECEVIEKYISDAEAQQTALAKIADSRKLTEEELKLIDNAIVELSQTADALENILEAREG